MMELEVPRRGAFIDQNGSILWMWDFVIEEREGAPSTVPIPPHVEEAIKTQTAILVNLEQFAAAGELHQSLPAKVWELRVVRGEQGQWKFERKDT